MQQDQFAQIFGTTYTITLLVFLVIYVIAGWKIFTKAGQPGWAAIVPIYNIYILLKIIGRPGWWVLLYFIPIVSFIINIVVALDLAKSFGRSVLFGVLGLWLFSIVGVLMLAFGGSKYVGPGGVAAAAPQPQMAQPDAQVPPVVANPPSAPQAPTPESPVQQ